MNKLLKVLEAIVHLWNQKNGHHESSETTSIADSHLAYALARCGARRERYYSGQMTGVPCSNLMRNMGVFIAFFFRRRAGDWGYIADALPSTQQLCEDFKSLAEIYTGKNAESGRGIEFYLRTQRRWTREMLAEWDKLCESFILKLRDSLGEPPNKSKKVGKTLSERGRWLQPLCMPKLHCMAAHISSFVANYRYLVAFTEEGFEHFQQVSLTS